jgi:hypothetical protein
MVTSNKAWLAACVFLLSSLSACRRDDIGQGIAVEVLRETETLDPFDGKQTVEQSPAGDAVVYLVPFGQDGTSPSAAPARLRLTTNADGTAFFPDVEGRYRIWVDVEDDGVIDAKSPGVRSGNRTTVIVAEKATGAESTIALSIERETYHPGDTIQVTLWGNFAAPHTVAVEIWNDAATRTRKHTVTLGEFAGEFSTATAIAAGAEWPLTPSSRLADYLVVPKVADEYFEGARFSLRRAVQSYNLSGLSMVLNNGDTVTDNRNVTANLTGQNVSTVALSEDPAALSAGTAPRLPFNTQTAYQLSAGDGLKTVYAMFYDIDGNYAGPISDSIHLDTQPVVPITGMSVEINYGAAITNSRTVELALAATGATFMAFSENLAAFPNGALRLPYATTGAYQLTAGDGVKTVWVMYYDAYGRYYGPVSDSITLSASVTIAPVTNATITINSGAAGTFDRNVTLTLGASNATSMALSEDPALFPNGVMRFPFSTEFGFRLSDGHGLKTVWVMYFDAGGNYYTPVSDTIAYDSTDPEFPDAGLMFVTHNPPGMHDFLSGLAGAVQANSLVTVYKDPFLTEIVTQGYAGADGSFSMLDIGDGSAGNVFKPQDWVFVTSTNFYGNESTAATMENDSTPPELRPEDIAGHWEIDNLGAGVGNIGDVFSAAYLVPVGFLPATDVTGGQADLSALGGPATATLATTDPTRYTYFYTLPPTLTIDNHELRIRMRIVDEAYNYSDWVATEPIFAVDTVPPDPASINSVQGGNRQINGRWVDPNLDSANYAVKATTATGLKVDIALTALDYCYETSNTSRACAYHFTSFDIGHPGIYVGHYAVENLYNCHDWYLSVDIEDDGGNKAGFSNAVSAYTTLPPPDYRTWSGIAKGTAMIAFGVESVVNATGYEVNFSTATGAPYSYNAGAYQSPFTFASADFNGYVTRFPGLPTNTVFYTATRSVDDTGPSRCYSSYSAETTARTEVYVSAVTDGAERATVGGALATVRDLDSDGYVDILAGAPYPRQVTLVSGHTGTGMSSFGIYQAPDSYDIPGTPIAAGNLDGPTDPEHEFIVGSPLETAGGKLLAGRVRIYDHDRTTLLAQLDGSEAGQQFGYSVTTVRATASGHTDFAVGGFGCAHKDCGYQPIGQLATEGPGRVVIYSGQTLTPAKTLPGYQRGDYFGVALAGGKDITGDGIADLAIGSPGSGYVTPNTSVTIVSGADYSVFRTLPLNTAMFWGKPRPGAAVAMIDDITGDGFADLAVGVASADGQPGAVVMLAGKTFHLIWMQTGGWANAGPNFGTVLATGGDVSGDGVPDLVVGAPLGQQNFFYGAGSAYVLDGATGKILYEFQGWGEGTGLDGSVGYSALLPGNLTGGSRAEWVVGAPGSAYGGYQSGRIYILSTDW